MSGICPICGGPRIAGETTFTADLGFGMVVVRHVPAEVCERCGEEWLSDQVAAELEEVVADSRKKHATVEVTDWRDRVAA